MENAKSAQAPVAGRVVQRPRRWPGLVWFSLAVLGFWYIEFAYQYHVLAQGDRAISLVRSLGFAGATLVACSLLSSIAFKFWPRLAVHWSVRRHLGVAGFIFTCFHVAAALRLYFGYDLGAVYFSWNPLVNPMVFGTVAFPILFAMAATSTDWAVRRLRRWWKFIHRFVYLAFLAVVFHFMLTNPPALRNLAGYLLITLTAATLFGQLYWFVRIARLRHFRSLGAAVGCGLIAAALIVAFLAYQRLSKLP